MKNQRLLSIAVIVLIVINAGILAFLFLDKKPGKMPQRPDELIIETLQLDEEQIAKFETFKHKHRSGITALETAEAPVMNAYFATLNSTAKDSILLDSLGNELDKAHRKKLEVTYEHFNDLKSLCRDDAQRKKFETLLPELQRMLMAGPRRKR